MSQDFVKIEHLEKEEDLKLVHYIKNISSEILKIYQIEINKIQKNNDFRLNFKNYSNLMTNVLGAVCSNVIIDFVNDIPPEEQQEAINFIVNVLKNCTLEMIKSCNTDKTKIH